MSKLTITLDLDNVDAPNDDIAPAVALILVNFAARIAPMHKGELDYHCVESLSGHNVGEAQFEFAEDAAAEAAKRAEQAYYDRRGEFYAFASKLTKEQLQRTLNNALEIQTFPGESWDSWRWTLVECLMADRITTDDICNFFRDSGLTSNA